MSIVKKLQILPYFEIIDRSDHFYIYRCKLCGEVMPSTKRLRHLRFKHPELYQKLKKEALGEKRRC